MRLDRYLANRARLSRQDVRRLLAEDRVLVNGETSRIVDLEVRVFDRIELDGEMLQAGQAARYLLLQPPLPLVARAPYGLIAGAAVALMPIWTRRPLRLPWLPVSETVALRPAGELVTRTLRWATVAPSSPT